MTIFWTLFTSTLSSFPLRFKAFPATNTESTLLVSIPHTTAYALLALDTDRGTPLERFSFGTYRALEAMGLGLEHFLTGQSTPRRPPPRPDSVRRKEASDPASRLTAAHRDRLLLEDRLREELVAAGFVLDESHVRLAGAGPGR